MTLLNVYWIRFRMINIHVYQGPMFIQYIVPVYMHIYLCVHHLNYITPHLISYNSLCQWNLK